MTESTQRTGTLSLLALGLIIACALGLRFTGLGFLLPGQAASDERVYEKQVRVLRLAPRWEAGPKAFAFYPLLVPRLVAALPAPDASAARTQAEHVAAARAERMQTRGVVALLSLLAIPALWVVARRFLPPPWPLAAAALLAFSPFLAWFAQQGRPHAALTSFLVLALAAALALRERPSWTTAAAAAASVALAVATLQNGLAALAPVGAALLLAEGLAWRKRALYALLALVGATLGYALFAPSLLDAGQTAAEAVREAKPGQLVLGNHVIDLEIFRGKGFARIASAFAEYEPLASALAVLAIAAWVVARLAGRAPKPGRDALVVAAFALPYLVLFGLYGRTYQRFVLPLVPIACLIAAAGLFALVRASRGRAWTRALAYAACAAVLLLQGWLAFGLSRARAAPSTIDEAARWVEEHVDGARERVSVSPGLELPLLPTNEAFEANRGPNGTLIFPWQWHLAGVGLDALVGPRWDVRTLPLGQPDERERARANLGAFLDAQGTDWLVLQVYDGWFPLLVALRAAARERGEPVARFSPWRAGFDETLPLAFQDDEMPREVPWAIEAARARCTGPVIEIYRLQPR